MIPRRRRRPKRLYRPKRPTDHPNVGLVPVEWDEAADS
jgi:hypothetical protein